MRPAPWKSSTSPRKGNVHNGEAAHGETIHALLLGNGFLFAFASGILLTETPLLQGNRHAGNIQLGFLLANLLAMGAAAMSGSMVSAYAFHFQAAFTLCAYLGFGLLMAEGRREPGRQAALAGFQGFFIM